MKAVIRSSRAAGSAAAPPSKSIAHRLLICAALARGESVIEGIEPSDDILATLGCLKALGAKLNYENGTVSVKGLRPESVPDGAVLNCNECGSTLRFLIPIALLTGRRTVFTGSERLLSRPLGVYETLCEKEGFEFKREPGRITVCGRLKSGGYEVPGDISSQFISGLLFALSVAGGESVIKILPPIESGPYIDMTVQALENFGVRIRREQGGTLRIDGGVRFAPHRMSVEGDYSNAAFLEALNLAGGDVTVTGLNKDSLQGDRVYRTLFDEIKKSAESQDVSIDISSCPDLGPALMAAAAMTGTVRLTGTRRLQLKESDRTLAMRESLAAFGVRCDVGYNEVTVYGGSLKKPEGELCGFNDHRIVMSLAVLCAVTGGIIDGAQAVNKSFPDFFEKIKTLGIEVETIGVDKQE